MVETRLAASGGGDGASRSLQAEPFYCIQKITEKCDREWLSGRRVLPNLLADVYRSPLAVQFGEKGFLLETVAGSQQFQERIFGVGFCATGVA
jgi:hypothetical protein